jgi:cell division protein FtsI/penicillin-binding protein 2
MPLTFTRRRRVLRPRNVFIVGLVLVVGAGAYLFVSNRKSSPPALPTSEVDGFLHAWQQGNTAQMASFVNDPPPDFATVAMSLVKSAPGSTATYTRTSLVRAPAGATGATATYHAHATIGGFGSVDWDGTLALTRVKVAKQTVWRITWTPGLVYPGLQTGQHFQFSRSWSPRASIMASDGSQLVSTQSEIQIQLLVSGVTTSLPQVKELMQRLVGTDPASIDAALHAPGVTPDAKVTIATVPDDARYEQTLRPTLAPVPGVFFTRVSGSSGGSALLSSQIVGSVGDITAERLKQLGPPYHAGDQAGRSGLEFAFERRLAGTPSGTLAIVSSNNAVAQVVKRFPGTAGEPVKITIDPHIQQAAESALAGLPPTTNAALVALDVNTGQIRAVVSKPDGGFSRAIDGSYAPGSTFKIITSTALLQAGRNANTPAPCPASLTVDGESFKNFEGEASGALDLANAFKISCNNAFIGLADQLPATALPSAAALYGFNVKWSLPLPSNGGSIPPFKDDAERAASAIGQGRVSASPAQMASVAAAVGAGTWHAPYLTTEPAVKPVTAAPIDPGVLANLRSFMTLVEQPGGTAAGAGLPAGVFGKTGTAETTATAPTNAWFVGYLGSLAFAVIVEGGGVGGQVAAPLAAKFLNAVG